MQTILDYLNKKWLSNFNEQFTIDLFPDEKKWLTEVAFHSKPNSNSLGGNFMLHDLVLAYNFPTDDVIYLFYELKNVKNNKILKQNNFKNDKNIGNVNDFNEKNSNPFENIDYYKRRIIAERLTPDIIEEYLNSLGWNLKAEAFWKSKGQSWLAVQTAFN